MKIRVKLLGHLRYYLEEKPAEAVLEVPEGSPLSKALSALKDLGVPPQEIALVTRSGSRLVPEDPLREGDLLETVPIAGGG